jgi:beta-galactosidase
MKLHHWILLAILVATTTWLILKTSTIDPRSEINLDVNWKFMLGDDPAASQIRYDDADWRIVSVPHDWMIEQPVSLDNPSGKANGFYPGGVGWYRRNINITELTDKEQFYLVFDGIYRDADIWLNGEYLGHQTNGYIGFQFDVTSLLRKDTANVLAIRTDCSDMPADRWYTGAGIYRDVRLIATEKLHFPVMGTLITTQLNEDGASVKAEIAVTNHDNRTQRFKLKSDLLAPDGTLVKSLISSRSVEAGQTVVIEEYHTIEDPKLWSTRTPNLYEIHSFLINKKKITDDQHHTFGIRTAEFTPDSGFILNGKKEMLKGVCLHHDGGELGAAVPDATWEYRLKILKGLGVNAIRLAHNPHDPVVLDLCDELGFMVIDEMYDKWETNWDGAAIDTKMEENYIRDLAYFIQRDRNHPSVILWSVGNETIEQLENPERGITWYLKLMNFVGRLDSTRQVTCALHPGDPSLGHELPSAYIHVSPVVAYNYRTDSFAAWHERYPNLVWIASETKAFTADRDPDFTQAEYSSNSWFHMDEYTAGQFIWTGVDYLGESMGWPDRGFRHGLLRTDGYVKPYAYFTRALYSEDPVVHLTVYDPLLADSLNRIDSWQRSWAGAPVTRKWNYMPGTEVPLHVFTNCDSVGVFQNDVLKGVFHASEYPARVINEPIIYEDGLLIAKGYYTDESGRTFSCSDTLRTAGSPVQISMYPDKRRLLADGRDVVHIETHVEDEHGTRHPESDDVIHYDLRGPGRIRVIDNGNLADHTPPGASSKPVNEGRHTLVIQSTFEPGDLIISASADGLQGATIEITSISPEN